MSFEEQRIKWKSLGEKHPVWELVRYYCSLRSKKLKEKFIEELSDEMESPDSIKSILKLDSEIASLTCSYLKERSEFFHYVERLLRTEDDSISFCNANNIPFSQTFTKNKSHHQSSKTLVATVSEIADKACKSKGVSIDDNPQSRCVWNVNGHLHVTARNLDGAIPGLNNPKIFWEIKEYWGKTKGGSKMSDAVYECHLIGKEIREFEKVAGTQIKHLVFVDGKDQWLHRKSDMLRFIDLECQGLIDKLFIGSEVEIKWKDFLLASL